MANFNRMTSAGDYYTNAAVLDEITLGTQYSVQFNGSNQYLQTTSTAVTGTYTIEFWVYNQSFGGVDGKGYVFNGTTSSNADRVQIGTSSTGQFYYYHENASAGSFSVTAGATLFSLNTWYHVAVVSNGTTLTLYINGISVGSGTISNTPSPGTNFYIGFLRSSGALQYHQGYISNFRYTRAVVYSGNFIQPVVPLTSIVNTVLLSCQSATIAESNPNGATVSSVVVPTAAVNRISPDGSFYTSFFDEVSLGSPYSVQLNGSSQYITSSGGAAYQLSGDFTVEFWMYATTPRQTNAIIICRNAAYTATNNMYLMFPSGSNKIALNKNGPGGVFGSVATLSLNTWYHIVFVRSGSGTNNLSLYINGALDSSITETSTWDWSNICIGSNPSDGGLPVATLAYGGYLSNLRIVKGTALYSAPFQSPAIPLNNLTNTSLLTFQSSTIIDNGTANTGGTGFTLTSTGSPTVSSTVYPTPVASKRSYSNGAIQIVGQFDDYTTITQTYSGYFNGSSSNIALGSNALIDIFGTSGSATVEFWYYSISATQVGHLFIAGPNGTNRTYLISQGSSLTLGTAIGGTFANRITSGISVVQNTWYHVAISRSGSTYTLYVNGQSQGSSSVSLYNNGGAGVPWYIGVQAYSPLATDWYNGYISNFRIVNGLALYTQNFTPTVSPLPKIGTTAMLTLQNATVVDNSGSGVSITPTSISVSNTIVPF